MKKLLLKSLMMMSAMLAVAIGFTSCGGDDDEAPEPTLTVSTTGLSTDANGGSESFQVTSNTSWSVSGYPSWVSVSPSSGKSGTSNVNIYVDANTSVDERTCTLLVSTTDGSLSQTVRITQWGIQASLEATPSVNVGSEKGAQNTFSIESNTSWSLSGVPTWLTVTPLNGNGNATITLTTLSANETAEERTANLTVTAGSKTATVTVTQAAGLENVKAVPSNLVSLYDQIAFELKAVGNIHKFRYGIYSETDLNRMSDKDIIDDLESGKEYTYNDEWIFFPGGFTENTTYYVCTIAYDGDYNRGELVKSPIKTRKFVSYDNDAYASLKMSFYDDSYNYIAFTFTKQAYCNKYHAIYGTNIDASDAECNPVLYAFQINYYLEHGKKHWFSENWDLTIQTDYPNDHSFIAKFDWTSSYGAIVGYSWGIFQDGSLSSDMIGTYADLYGTGESSKQIVPKKVSRKTTRSVAQEYTTLGIERQKKANMTKKR